MAGNPSHYHTKYDTLGMISADDRQMIQLCVDGLSPLSCLALHNDRNPTSRSHDNTAWLLSLMSQWTRESPSARIVATVIRERKLHGYWEGESSAGRLLCEHDFVACRFADDLKPRYWSSLEAQVSGLD